MNIVPTVEPDDESESEVVPESKPAGTSASKPFGLEGFSSNLNWANPDALWSHHPVQPGPKAGFHDPIEAAPQRAQLWGAQNEPEAADDAAAFQND